MVGRELMNRTNESIGRYENEQKDKNYMQDTFCEQVCTYIKQLQRKEQEKAKKLGKTSYRMLTGEKKLLPKVQSPLPSGVSSHQIHS